jgi:hypothetical protein
VTRGAGQQGPRPSTHMGPVAPAAGFMHDQMVEQWGNVRSYVVKDGHLFVALVADGGTYEFEPVRKTKP